MIIPALGLAGVLISAYVWYKQVTSGPVLCIGTGCARVIRSRYGRLLGIPNGALGVFYFGGAAIAALIDQPAVSVLLAAATLVALPLYGYLTYLQYGVLKAWCVWCLASAGLTLAIALSVLVR